MVDEHEPCACLSISDSQSVCKGTCDYLSGIIISILSIRLIILKYDGSPDSTAMAPMPISIRVSVVFFLVRKMSNGNPLLTATIELLQRIHYKIKKKKLEAYAMKRVAAGAHIRNPWLFQPAKRPDDRANHRPRCSFLQL